MPPIPDPKIEAKIRQAMALALSHQEAGRLRPAANIYRRVLGVDAHNADALHFLGVIAHKIGRADLAIDLLARSVSADPSKVGFHLNLGNLYLKQQRLDEAVECYRSAIALEPAWASAHAHLGAALAKQGRVDDANAAFRRALELRQSQEPQDGAGAVDPPTGAITAEPAPALAPVESPAPDELAPPVEMYAPTAQVAQAGDVAKPEAGSADAAVPADFWDTAGPRADAGDNWALDRAASVESLEPAPAPIDEPSEVVLDERPPHLAGADPSDAEDALPAPVVGDALDESAPRASQPPAPWLSNHAAARGAMVEPPAIHSPRENLGFEEPADDPPDSRSSAPSEAAEPSPEAVRLTPAPVQTAPAAARPAPAPVEPSPEAVELTSCAIGTPESAIQPATAVEPAPLAMEPTPSALESVTSAMEPAASTLEPAAFALEPAAPTLEPPAPTQEPAASAVEPAAAAQEPAAAAQEPAAAALEPAAPTQEPAAAAQEPAAAALEPAAPTQEPAAAAVEPAPGAVPAEPALAVEADSGVGASIEFVVSFDGYLPPIDDPADRVGPPGLLAEGHADAHDEAAADSDPAAPVNGHAAAATSVAAAALATPGMGRARDGDRLGGLWLSARVDELTGDLAESFPIEESAPAGNGVHPGDVAGARYNADVPAGGGGRTRPPSAESLRRMALNLVSHRKLPEAIELLTRAVTMRPNFAEAHRDLGGALLRAGDLESAVVRLKRALELRPNFAEAWGSLGDAYQLEGKIDRAIRCYRRLLELAPTAAKVHSNMLLSMNYDGRYSPASTFQEHLRWAERHAEPLGRYIRPHGNDRSVDRRLKIGYVSPDFRRHSVNYFIEPVLSAHDRSRFHVTCYSDVIRPDGVTRELAGLCDEFREVRTLGDEGLAEQIRADEIDILVDLAGHTGNNRLLAFAFKPAPVQVTYLGYPNTTGMSTIDYRLTDAWADPSGRTERLHSERLVRLPESFLCYRPPAPCPSVGPPPCLKAGHVTFGCFNILAKVTTQVMALWARILLATPGSRLVLKGRGSELSHESRRQYVRDVFVYHGVESDRLDLLGKEPDFTDHLARYNQLDIVLDPFPYNGTTTTCEALWMGLPVISLAGDRHVSRVGVSILSNAGLSDLIAWSPDQYVRIAANLARAPGEMARIRVELRERLGRSILTDSARFTRSLEHEYRQMWLAWTESQAGDPLVRDTLTLHE